MRKTYEFPQGFLWGSATSAYQTEGYNSNTDWWEWEHTKKPNQKYPLDQSGVACDSYHRYAEDFTLCETMHNNAVRFSVEWARIEPKEGVFDQNEIEHYKTVIAEAKKHNLKVFLTLHHFTNPLWFSKKGGWLNFNAPNYFARYAQKCAESFGTSVDCFLTINEPQVLTIMGYLNGTWPPNHTNPFEVLMVQFNLISSHRRAYESIKKINKNLQVGLVKHIFWFEAAKGPLNFLDSLICKVLYFLNTDTVLLPILDRIDVIGVNYYFTTRIKNLKRANLDDNNSDMNWWIVPNGLKNILVDLKRLKKPIYVTENGLADHTDAKRPDFINKMLIACHQAITEGTDLRGYFHWSLLDNYEWHSGYWPRFGLIDVDRTHDLARKPRKSFYYYATIAKENKVTE